MEPNVEARHGCVRCIAQENMDATFGEVLRHFGKSLLIGPGKQGRVVLQEAIVLVASNVWGIQINQISLSCFSHYFVKVTFLQYCAAQHLRR
jgi:hypothetical protein